MVTTTMDGAGSRWLPRWMWWIIVFGVMLLVFYGAWRIGLKRAIARELAAIKAAGYPTTPVEMQAWYPPLPPEAENAAKEILEAAKLMKTPEEVFGKEKIDARPLLDAKWLTMVSEDIDLEGKGPGMELKSNLVPLFGNLRSAKYDETYPAQCMELGRMYVEANRQALEKLEAAEKIEASRYPADYSRGAGARPSLGGIWGVCNLSRLAAMDAERTGDSERATGAIVSLLGLERSMRREPTVVSQLMRSALTGSAVSSLQRMADRMKFDGGQLARMQAGLASAQEPEGWRRGVIGELTIYQEGFHNPEAVWGYKSSKWGHYWGSVGGIYDYCQLHYLRVMQRYRDIAGLAEWEQIEQAKRVDEQTRTRSFEWTKPMELVPVLGQAFEVHLRAVAQARCATAALAAQRFRLEHGKWPGSWGELVPGYLEGEPIDPFTGKALMMKVADGVLTVYSVGEDLTDNGGVRLNGGGQMFGAGADVVFEIGR